MSLKARRLQRQTLTGSGASIKTLKGSGASSIKTRKGSGTSIGAARRLQRQALKGAGTSTFRS